MQADACVETLRKYESLIDSLSADDLAKMHPQIPRDIDKLISDSDACLSTDVCEALADCLLSFMCPKSKNKDPGRPGIWAADQLAKKSKGVSDTVENLQCTKSQCWAAVEEYPADFFQLLSDEDIVAFSKCALKPCVMGPLVEELAKRDLEFSSSVFDRLDLSSVDGRLVFQAFLRIVEAPTMEDVVRFWNVFEVQPPLHLVCVNACLDRNKDVIRMFGRVIQQRFPLKYPLWMFYHKSIRTVAEEVDAASGNPENVDTESFSDSLSIVPFQHTSFLMPLVLEFPDWLDVIQQCDPSRHTALLDLLN